MSGCAPTMDLVKNPNQDVLSPYIGYAFYAKQQLWSTSYGNITLLTNRISGNFQITTEGLNRQSSGGVHIDASGMSNMIPVDLEKITDDETFEIQDASILVLKGPDDQGRPSHFIFCLAQTKVHGRRISNGDLLFSPSHDNRKLLAVPAGKLTSKTPVYVISSSGVDDARDFRQLRYEDSKLLIALASHPSASMVTRNLAEISVLRQVAGDPQTVIPAMSQSGTQVKMITIKLTD